MSQPPLVLCIGLPADHHIIPAEMRDTIALKIKEAFAEMNKSAYDWEFYPYAPEDRVEDLAAKLRSKPWDVVLIGSGERTFLQLTTHFETMVNAIHTECPKAKFAFNESPETSLAACQRVMPT